MLTHIDLEGNPKMVDVSKKLITRRVATAAGYLSLCTECAMALEKEEITKGDPWAVAHIGAINGAKHTWELIPLAHPLTLDSLNVEHYFDKQKRLAWLMMEVSVESRTGVEMEAITGVSLGLLVLYDMLKAISHKMEIGPVRLLLKDGGRRGLITQPWDECPWTM